jgi:hypothetical protein
LHVPQGLALAAFAGFAVYREYLRPVLYSAAMWMIRRRSSRSLRTATQVAAS